jgi:AcrR family transcriptional regulator
MTKQTDTEKRIIHAARGLFVAQGFQKTSMEEIAHNAGVSRLTIYRYFGDKKELVRTLFTYAAGIFRRMSESVADETLQNPLMLLNMFQTEMSKLGDASLLGRFDELKRVYPDIFEEYRAIRKNALDAIFDRFVSILKQQDALRKGVNETVLRHLFFDAIVNAIDNPELAGRNISREEILKTVREVFLHGIIETPEPKPVKSKSTNKQRHDKNSKKRKKK